MNKILTPLFIILLSSTTYGKITVEDVQKVIDSSTNSIKQIQTYEFNLIKREYANGEDTGYQLLTAKVQVEPLKIYLKFLKPRRYAGREAIYHDDTIIVRHGGTYMSDLVLIIDPLSPLAMDGNRYPITHMNPNVICGQLVNNIKSELKFNPTIEKRPNAKYRDLIGTHYKLIHSHQAAGMQCKTAEMIISDEYNIPIYFKVVNWANVVVEEYAFSEIVVNRKLPDNIFDRENPDYELKDKIK